jgi:Transglutaminase-like superfamily
MWKLLQRFNALDRPAQSLLLRAAVLLPVLAVSLRLRGLRATQASLSSFLPGSIEHNIQSRASGDATKDASEISRMVQAAARYGVMRPTCLEKSLALWWLLGRRGMASSLRIGTRKAASGLEAHAWVEFDGKALNEPNETRDRYTAFEGTLPAPYPK